MVVTRGPVVPGDPRTHHHPHELLRSMLVPASTSIPTQMAPFDGKPAARSVQAWLPTKGTPPSTSTSPTATARGSVISNVLSRATRCCAGYGRLRRLGNAAAAMGAEVEVLKGDLPAPFAPAEVEVRLRRRYQDPLSRRSWRCRSHPPRAATTTCEAIGKAAQKSTGAQQQNKIPPVHTYRCVASLAARNRGAGFSFIFRPIDNDAGQRPLSSSDENQFERPAKK